MTKRELIVTINSLFDDTDETFKVLCVNSIAKFAYRQDSIVNEELKQFIIKVKEASNHLKSAREKGILNEPVKKTIPPKTLVQKRLGMLEESDNKKVDIDGIEHIKTVNNDT
jgi:hypothetical protein